MAYRVTAPQITAKDMSGKVHYYLHGQIIPWLSPESRAHLLAFGLVEETPDLVPPGVVAQPSTEAPKVVAPQVNPAEPGTEAPARPGATASKDTWAQFVVGSGAATAEEAAQLTKDQLIQLCAS